MITIRRELELLIFIFLMGAASIVLLAHKNASTTIQFATPKLPTFVTSPLPTLSPTPIVQTASVDSPDSSESLIMKKQTTQQTTTYSFSLLTISTNSERFLFMKNMVLGQSFILPANAWAPDNAYVFVKEITATGNNYYVLSTVDSSITMDQNQVNISDFFAKRYPNYKISDVTGWAAPNLIVVNTTTDTGAFLSFWFDVPTKSFIPLATQFH